MKKSVLILLSALLLLIALLSILPIHSESLIYDEVLRLHVIANSDSDADQELKLLVRDAILEETQKILKNVKSREEAEKIISEHSALLENIALETVRKNRFDYSVALELGKEKYGLPEKEKGVRTNFIR